MANSNQTIPVPRALRFWFIIHFFADILAAIPLFVKPELLVLFGWNVVDPYTTRLVAAALFGIGIESWIGRNAKAETYKNMLNLKIIWSATAALGILLSIIQGAQGTPAAALAVLVIFVVFHFIWVYWRFTIGRLLKVGQ
jgi:hypothetical protein